MFSLPIRSVIEKSQLLTATPETTVSAAAKLMAKKRMSAVVIVHGHHVLGIFTEHDAVVRVMAKGLDIQTTQLSEVMTKTPITVDADDVFGYALILMHEHGFRHVPVMEHDRLIGIVSARDALNPDLEEFVVEAERRKHFLRPNA
jgi:CBS domain-containing protein